MKTFFTKEAGFRRLGGGLDLWKRCYQCVPHDVCAICILILTQECSSSAQTTPYQCGCDGWRLVGRFFVVEVADHNFTRYQEGCSAQCLGQKQRSCAETRPIVSRISQAEKLFQERVCYLQAHQVEKRDYGYHPTRWLLRI